MGQPNPLSQTQTVKTSKLNSPEKNEFVHELDKKTNYINSILNKFNKRTDDKIIKNMKVRDNS